MNLLSVSNNIEAGMNLAKAETIGTLKYLINDWAVPVLAVICIGFLLFFIVQAGIRRKRGEETEFQISAILICVIALVLVMAFPVWGWRMIGM